MYSIFYTVFMLALVAISLYSSYEKYFKSHRPKTNNLQVIEDLTQELKLTFSEHSSDEYTGGWIHGSYQGVSINIQDEATVHSSRSGNYITVKTLYEALLDKQYIIDGLEVFREELLSKVSKVFGAEDIQIGHEEIDKAFIIRANSELDAQRLFASPDVRDSFLALQKMCSKFRLKDGILTLEYPDGIFEASNKLRERIEALVVCSHAIMNHKEHTPETLPQPVAQERLFEKTESEKTSIENTTIHW